MPERSPLADLLASTHLAVPDELPDLVAEHAQGLDALDAVIHLVDREQRWLVPLPRHTRPAGPALPIDQGAAGRSFQLSNVEETLDGDERCRWVPIVDGTERLGVLEVRFHAATPIDAELVLAYAGLVAELLMTKNAYGAFFERARRRQPMSIGAEIAWRLLPPLTFATADLVITGITSPAYELGGDVFHYAVDREHARLGVFDAMGHGLRAGLLATAALAAYRNACVEGLDQSTAAGLIDATIAAEFMDSFVTGVTAQLHIETGELTWCNAGHPAPLLIRDGRLAEVLDDALVQPYGTGLQARSATVRLEPGDRVVLYTDGLTEARTPDGVFFGIDRLVGTIADASAGGLPPPETMRRVMHAVLDHHDGVMQDDATVVALEWRGPGPASLVVT
jgi:serine phosphatase RsbU (regulator of sigma subunit)